MDTPASETRATTLGPNRSARMPPIGRAITAATAKTAVRVPAPTGSQADAAILDAIRQHGLSLLPWSKDAETLRQRLSWLHRGLGAPWPDMSDAALVASLDDWLLPFLRGSALLAADEAPTVLEGDWPCSKIVMMAFDDEPAARAFLDSPLYGEISEDRIAGAKTTALLVRGRFRFRQACLNRCSARLR